MLHLSGTAASALILLSISAFYHGFFRPRALLPGHASELSFQAILEPLSEQCASWHREHLRARAQRFGRVVIMVIDAMGDDLVADYAGSLNYTVGRLRSEGIHVIAEASVPTVTMPCIKALTTGTAPNFIDAAVNLGSTALTMDNLVYQLAAQRRRLLLYGDETWLQLFPRGGDSEGGGGGGGGTKEGGGGNNGGPWLNRSEGTTSFFVNDITTVDTNITRHLASELNASDWDVMVLHYLGLDHIGHSRGKTDRASMQAKMVEMDRVVQQVHQGLIALDAKDDLDSHGPDAKLPSLLVILSDHGMNIQGNHGGPSSEETQAFFGMISTSPTHLIDPLATSLDAHTRPAMISQLDIAPTLATLLGIPIPVNSLGKVFEAPYAAPSRAGQTKGEKAPPNAPSQPVLYDHLAALYRNAAQIAPLLKLSRVPQLEENSFLASLSSAQEKHSRMLEEQCLVGRIDDQGTVSDIPLAGSLGETVWLLGEEAKDSYRTCLRTATDSLRGQAGDIKWLHIGFAVVACTVGMVWSGAVAFVGVRTQKDTADTAATHSLTASGFATWFAVAGTVTHGAISPFSSSRIEEEHLVYFFSLTTLLILLVRQSVAVGVYRDGAKHVLLGSVGSMVLLRIFMLWNRSGVKWSALPSIATGFHEAITAKAISPKTVNMLGLLCVLIVVSTGAVVWFVVATTTSLRHRGTMSKLWRIVFVSVNVVGMSIVTLFKLTEVLPQPRTSQPSSSTTQWASVAVLSHFARSLHYCVDAPRISWAICVCLLISASWVAHAAFLWVQLACVSQHSVASLQMAELFSLELLLGILQFCLVVHHPINVPVTVGLVMLFLCFEQTATGLTRLSASCAKSVGPLQWLLPLLLFHWMCRCSFFLTGNSNSVATIDMRGATIGMADASAQPSMAWMGFSTFVTVATGPLLGLAVLSKCVASVSTAGRPLFRAVASALVALEAMFLVCYFFILINARHHLFIWSVFAPKIIYVSGFVAFTTGVALVFGAIANRAESDG